MTGLKERFLEAFRGDITTIAKSKLTPMNGYAPYYCNSNNAYEFYIVSVASWWQFHGTYQLLFRKHKKS